MDQIKVGIFEIEVSDPWPCWITIRSSGEELGKFSAKHLPDLKFAVARAQQAAIRAGHGSEAESP